MEVAGRAGGAAPTRWSRHRNRSWLRAGWSRQRSTGWGTWLAVVCAGALAIRVATVLGRPGRVPGGDAYFYHYAANLLVAGKGYINPFIYYGHVPHQVVPTADFPPGFVFVLAAASLVGFKSFFAQRIWCCIIGAGAVAVCGLAGREVAGRRVGLICAVVVAVYPNIWMDDELGMSETITPLLVAVVLLTAYRFWKRPGRLNAVWLGLSVGFAALCRDELALLGLFVAVPVTLLARSLSWRRRAGALALAAASAVVVVGPWVGYNMSRFEDPVFISTGLGVTLASANCPPTYSGPMEGYWQFTCALAAPINKHDDDSVQAGQARRYALRYITSHENRLLPVEMARLGRAFGAFHPLQQIRLDSSVETRPYRWALTGLAGYYLLAALSLGGLVVLVQRRVPVYPLLAPGLVVVVSVTLAFGDTRYRTPFEVSLALLAAVQIDWLVSAAARRRRRLAAGVADTVVERQPSVARLPAVQG